MIITITIELLSIISQNSNHNNATMKGLHRETEARSVTTSGQY